VVPARPKQPGLRLFVQAGVEEDFQGRVEFLLGLVRLAAAHGLEPPLEVRVRLEHGQRQGGDRWG
jgi:hypothetical protein